MQTESECLLSFSQWHHEDPASSAGWEGSTDSSLPEPELYMTLFGAPQDDPCSHLKTFSLEGCPMSTSSDATLPSYLCPCPPPTQFDSPNPSSQSQSHPSSSMSERPDHSLLCCPAHERIVHLLLSCGADVNIQNANGQTPLHIAAQQGHLGIVRLLLASKFIDVNAQDRCGATPLHLASENGHVMIVKLLVAHNAHLNVRATSV
ncbi:uncharacterized protein N7477_004860 [Penicillium maclennaniae]|uniref:uncharacterized protein n=1 Tax=Penicillium maclennaniae TaxID=1343394 RepID=UPI0025404F29|nr:uncharacterized protein N7477_004860 [Penicillium maclennaniae]KAJ5674926.1 hypothetical protein N7477_004860 [Penicillium maclennaniae]